MCHGQDRLFSHRFGKSCSPIDRGYPFIAENPIHHGGTTMPHIPCNLTIARIATCGEEKSADGTRKVWCFWAHLQHPGHSCLSFLGILLSPAQYYFYPRRVLAKFQCLRLEYPVLIFWLVKNDDQRSHIWGRLTVWLPLTSCDVISHFLWLHISYIDGEVPVCQLICDLSWWLPIFFMTQETIPKSSPFLWRFQPGLPTLNGKYP